MRESKNIVTVDMYTDDALRSIGAAYDLLRNKKELCTKDGSWPGYRNLLAYQYQAAKILMQQLDIDIFALQFVERFVKAYDELNDWYYNR